MPRRDSHSPRLSLKPIHSKPQPIQAAGGDDSDSDSGSYNTSEEMKKHGYLRKRSGLRRSANPGDRHKCEIDRSPGVLHDDYLRKGSGLKRLESKSPNRRVYADRSIPTVKHEYLKRKSEMSKLTPVRTREPKERQPLYPGSSVNRMAKDSPERYRKYRRNSQTGNKNALNVSNNSIEDSQRC